MSSDRKYYLLVFELETPSDLCRVLYWDFLIHPSPKLLLREHNEIFFFSSCYLRGRDNSYLCFGFSVATSKRQNTYLVCSEDKGYLSETPDSKASASIRIFDVVGLFGEHVKELEFNHKLFFDWAYLIRANKKVVEHIISRGRRIFLMPTLADYLISVGKNIFRIIQLNDKLNLGISPAMFHNIRLYQITSKMR